MNPLNISSPPSHFRKRKRTDYSSGFSSSSSNSIIQTKTNKCKGQVSCEEMAPPPPNVTDYLADDKWPTKLDKKLVRLMLKAQNQKRDFKGLSWSDERLWQCAVKKINVLISTHQDFKHLEHKSIESVKYRLNKLKKAYDWFQDDSSWTLGIELAKLVTCESYTGPLVIPITSNNSRVGPSRSCSSYRRAFQSVNNIDFVRNFLENLRAIKNSITTEQYCFAIQDFKTILMLMLMLMQVKCTCAEVEIPYISSSAPFVSATSGSSGKRKYDDISSTALEKEVAGILNSLARDKYITQEMADDAAILYGNLINEGKKVVVRRFCGCNCVDDKIVLLNEHMHKFPDYMS